MDLIEQLARSLQPAMTYNDKEVADDVLDKVFAAVRWTPSAANLQPWEVVSLREQDSKQQVVAASLDPMLRSEGHGVQDWIINAPVVLVFVADMKRVRSRYGEGAYKIAPNDVAAALYGAMITACQLGLRCCWVREYDPKTLQELLMVPKTHDVVGVLTLGYSDQPSSLPPTLPPERFLHYERW